MIVCLYGRAFAPFVEPVVRDLYAETAQLGGELVPLTIERALADRAADRTQWTGVRRVYVLPFDVPATLPAAAPAAPDALVRWLFRGAEVVNPFDVHEIGWDKFAATERWLGRGVPVPETLLTHSPADATAFVQQHEFAILKALRSCGGHGDFVTLAAADGLVAEARGQRYELEFVPSGTPACIRDRRLFYPAPFYLQRLVGDVGARGVLTPAQQLRAYVVDGQLVLWADLDRPRHRRPSDWIVTAALGARHRFLFSIGEEARKVALRAAEVIGLRFGVVDLIRTSREGAFVIAAYTDGYHMLIDRSFKQLPEFRAAFDLDRFIAEALVAEPSPFAPVKP